MDTKDLEMRANAMMQELARQRNAALDQCVVLQADIVLLQTTIKNLEESKKPETTKPK